MKETWELTDHACRVCAGRILYRVDESGKRVAKCSECEATGEDPGSRTRAIEAVCACGKRHRNGRDAGHRCERNEHVCPELPQIIVISVGKE